MHDLPFGKDTVIGETSTGGILKLMQIMEEYEAVFVSGVNATLRNGIVKYCVDKGKACYFVPHTGDVITAGAEHIRSFSGRICRARRCRPTPEYLLIKRVMDITLSLVALILFSPFMAITALAIRSYDGGPVLYKQVRLTKEGKPFEILNLRWMRVVHGLHRIPSEIGCNSCACYTTFFPAGNFRHPIASFMGVSAA